MTAAVIGFTAAPAGAHPLLLATAPADGQIVDRLPRSVRLTFNEPVTTGFDAIRVYNDRGLRVDRGRPHASHRDVRIGLAAALAPGTYVVHWRAIGRDGHVATDSFVFHYRHATRAGVVRVGAGDPKTARAVLRGAVLVLLGVLWARALLVGGRRRGLVIVTLVAAGALLCADAMGLSGLPLADALHPSVLGPVLSTTTGVVRGLQLALLVVMAAWPPLAALGAGVALGAEAWVGHAVTAPHETVAIAALVVHLLAMGLWLGGLAVVIRHRDALPRYRPLAAAAVVLLIATGTVNAWIELGRWNRLWSTHYGRLLTIKLALVAIVIAVAWVNRRRPRLLVPELLLQVAIVAFAVLLGTTAPARSGTGPVSRVFELGPWRASFVVDPDLAGANEVHLFLLAGPGHLADDVSSAVITVQPAKGGSSADVRLTAQGNGHYVTETAALRRSGRWVASIVATGKDGRHYAHRIPFSVSP